MKQLLITIAALVLVGCGEEKKDYSGKYKIGFVDIEGDVDFGQIEINSDGSFIDHPPSWKTEKIKRKGNWRVEGDYLKLSFPSNNKYVLKSIRYYDKNTLTHIKTDNFLPSGEIEKKKGDLGLLKKIFSLLKCKTCKGKVSSEAKVCPHCGQPDPVEKV